MVYFTVWVVVTITLTIVAMLTAWLGGELLESLNYRIRRHKRRRFYYNARLKHYRPRR